MIRTKTEYKITSRGLAAIFVLFLLVMALFFVLGTQTGRAITIVNTSTISYTTSVVSEIVATTSIVEIHTVTFIGNASVVISGMAKTDAIGTTATGISFINFNDTSKTYTAVISNGHYEQTLPNHAYYHVEIHYTTSVGGIGAGVCKGLALVLFSAAGTLKADWDC